MLGIVVIVLATGAIDAAGLDASVYELHAAVVRALDARDGSARRAHGERLFEGCLVLGPNLPSSGSGTDSRSFDA